MAAWVTRELEALLHEINEVPMCDNRDKKQLTILMNGFMKINSQAMENAAARTKARFSEMSEANNSSEPSDDPLAELTRLKPIE